MRNVLDVIKIQTEVKQTQQSKAKLTDYKNASDKNIGSRFLVECSIKLNMKPLTSSTACILYHRFNRETNEYDDFLVASSCLYLAGKIKDDPIKIRDVINVSHCTLNRGAPVLELDEEYWTIRDSILQMELLIIRMLNFSTAITHPHKYLLHYMKSLQEWFGVTTWNTMPVAKVAAGYLQDFHQNPIILNYKPSHIAICCLSLAFQVYGIRVPLTDVTDDSNCWYHGFVNDLSKELHWEIIERIIETYKTDECD